MLNNPGAELQGYRLLGIQALPDELIEALSQGHSLPGTKSAEVMSACKHEILRLLPVMQHKVRCRHCSLVITEEELGSGCCPECLEVHKVRRRDFDKIIESGSEQARYCCDGCGMIIDC